MKCACSIWNRDKTHVLYSYSPETRNLLHMTLRLISRLYREYACAAKLQLSILTSKIHTHVSTELLVSYTIIFLLLPIQLTSPSSRALLITKPQGKLFYFFPVREKSGNVRKMPHIREKSGNFDWPVVTSCVSTKTGN